MNHPSLWGHRQRQKTTKDKKYSSILIQPCNVVFVIIDDNHVNHFSFYQVLNNTHYENNLSINDFIYFILMQR